VAREPGVELGAGDPQQPCRLRAVAAGLCERLEDEVALDLGEPARGEIGGRGGGGAVAFTGTASTGPGRASGISPPSDCGRSPESAWILTRVRSSLSRPNPIRSCGMICWAACASCRNTWRVSSAEASAGSSASSASLRRCRSRSPPAIRSWARGAAGSELRHRRGAGGPPVQGSFKASRVASGPLSRSRSTGQSIPCTVPLWEYCQSSQVLHPAGRVGLATP
jgi:hypothetical protein